MSKNRYADEFYKILGLWEDAFQHKKITVDSYMRYVNRLFVKWYGLGEEEIYSLLKGLYDLGENAGHDTVKSVVFHLIETGGKYGI